MWWLCFPVVSVYVFFFNWVLYWFSTTSFVEFNFVYLVVSLSGIVLLSMCPCDIADQFVPMSFLTELLCVVVFLSSSFWVRLYHIIRTKKKKKKIRCPLHAIWLVSKKKKKKESKGDIEFFRHTYFLLLCIFDLNS